MLFVFRVALRYLTSGALQTVLIGSGVAIGIVAYTFMAALINGLEISLTNDVIGNLAHVVLEPIELEPQVFERRAEAAGAVRLAEDEAAGAGAARSQERLVAVQRANQRRREIPGWRPLLETIEADPSVRAVAPSASGSGFIRRGEKAVSVSFIGTLPESRSVVVDLEGSIVEGDSALGTEDLLIGIDLAEQLGLVAGQRVRVLSERGRERTLRVRGLFDLRSGSLNERVAFVGLETAQSLLELEGAITRFELKLFDVYEAREVAARLDAATGLEASNWIDDNARLQSALRAQGSTGTLIKVFSLMAILIGVASTLSIAALRRRAEIGILRSFGVAKRTIAAIFVTQGLLVGLIGSGVGALGGWSFCWLLLKLTTGPDGEPALPVDPAQGEYGVAIALASVAGTVAAFLPARSAARVDPVEVIQQ